VGRQVILLMHIHVVRQRDIEHSLRKHFLVQHANSAHVEKKGCMIVLRLKDVCRYHHSSSDVNRGRLTCP
jgi:hypothetical protein